MASTPQTPTAVTALDDRRGDSSPTCRPRGAVAADISGLEQVLEDGHVTFNAVARVWFHLCDDSLSDADHQRCERLFPALLSAFGEPRGGIITAYFCKHLKIAAALTDIHTAAKLGETPPAAESGEALAPKGPGDRLRAARHGRIGASSSAIHVECAMGDPVDPKARELLFRCLDVHYRAIEFLQPKPRKVCMRMLMGVITSLLGSLDEREVHGRPAVGADPEEIECLNGMLDQARRYYERSAHRQAQIEYFLGMGLGTLLLSAFFVVMALIGDARLDTEPLLYTSLAAGLGAFVSVLARMTRGQLVLSYESGRTIMRLLGGIRPMLGALCGTAVYVLLASGMLTIAPPSNGKEAYYFLGIAFLAGFSERFAQDMIAKTPGAEAAPQQTVAPAAVAVQRAAAP
jgi:hypothetical protein